MKKQIQSTPFVMPKVAHKGTLELSGIPVNCYVLDNGERILSLRNAVKAISNKDNGNLDGYNPLIQKKKGAVQNQPVSSGNPLIHNEKGAVQNIEFLIEETDTVATGISTDYFVSICEAYVKGLSERTLKTERQKEIAYRCAIILSGFARVGIISLVDEATGYQKVREETELRDKFSAFVSEHIRSWEKTFSDRLWTEFARLTRYQGNPFTNRPSYWGRLVRDTIYMSLDAELYGVLKEKKGAGNSKLHQGLTEEIGVKVLTSHIDEIIGISKVCDNVIEFKSLVKERYSKTPVQTNLKLYLK